MNNPITEHESFRDLVSTVTKDGERNWIHALKPKGRFYSLRKLMSYLYIAFFLGIPFIKVNGEPLLMINIFDGRFIIFSKIFWPQDFFIFAIGMISLIVFIILFTIIYGRLFCGWVCPQTVFMEFIFRPIEWLIEGSPSSQKKLNASSWNMNKLSKKIIKHSLFLLASFIIVNTFMSYLIGIDQVFLNYSQLFKDHGVLLFGLIFFTILFYCVFAFVRELVCTTICPYGRLQSVMTDKNTMQISYDYHRGEERGRYKKNEIRTNGDCVDCMKCVIVCPTGIDIRNGVQMECVGCTACIDACDEVMESLHFPKGLIRYASENQIHEKKSFKFNTRIKAYTAVLVILTTFISILIYQRREIDCYISRVKGQLYQETKDGKISNLFDAKIINKLKTDQDLTIKLENQVGEIKLVGKSNFNLKGDQINDFTFFVEIPSSQIHHHIENIEFGIYSGNEKIQTIRSKFLGPFN